MSLQEQMEAKKQEFLSSAPQEILQVMGRAAKTVANLDIEKTVEITGIGGGGDDQAQQKDAIHTNCAKHENLQNR